MIVFQNGELYKRMREGSATPKKKKESGIIHSCGRPLSLLILCPAVYFIVCVSLSFVLDESIHVFLRIVNFS